MIKLIQTGTYHLLETQENTKILTLNGKKTYAWSTAGINGEIFITSHKTHRIDHMLAIGKYRLYDVKNEKNLKELQHLELLVGQGLWQGYALPDGLPNEPNKKNQIIPIGEIITKSQTAFV